MHTEPLATDLKIYWVKAFNPYLFDFKLTTELNKQTSVAIHNKEQRLYCITLKQLLKKQNKTNSKQQQQQTLERRKSDFQSFHIIHIF